MAFQHYNLALEHFVKALEVETSATAQKIIKDKVKDYLTRAEQLKQLLHGSSSSYTSSKSTMSTSSTSTSSVTQNVPKASIPASAQYLIYFKQYY